MIKYKVRYCLRDDRRHALTLDTRYDTITEAMEAAQQMEKDPEVFVAWHEQDLNESDILNSMKEVLADD